MNWLTPAIGNRKVGIGGVRLVANFEIPVLELRVRFAYASPSFFGPGASMARPLTFALVREAADTDDPDKLASLRTLRLEGLQLTNLAALAPLTSCALHGGGD